MATDCDIRFASSDKVEIVQSERQKLEFSYHDQVGYHFMDPSTYDTVTFQEEFIAESKDLLIDALLVEVLFVDGKAVTIELPPSIELEVTESAPGVKGDTATSATKEATLQTGLRIQVPLFVGPGDRNDDLARASFGEVGRNRHEVPAVHGRRCAPDAARPADDDFRGTCGRGPAGTGP